MAVTLLDLFSSLPSPWKEHLVDLEETFDEISRRISTDRGWRDTLIPRPEQIFSALEIAPDKVQVVIVGQDPYPNRSYAMGRAFAVPDSTLTLPGSLRNILKEKIADVGGDLPSPSLKEWEMQGVMLLNSALTTRVGESGAHLNVGWDAVTRRVMECVAKNDAVGVLWGKSAAGFQSLFGARVIIGTHPSPLSAHRGFFGSKPFSRLNDLLRVPIDW